MKKYLNILSIALLFSLLLTLFSCGASNTSVQNSTAVPSGGASIGTTAGSAASGVANPAKQWSYDTLAIGPDRVEYEPNRAGQPAEPQVVGNKNQDKFVWLRNARLNDYTTPDEETIDYIVFVFELFNETDEKMDTYGIGFTFEAYQDGQKLEEPLGGDNFKFDYSAIDYPERKVAVDYKHHRPYAKPGESLGFVRDFTLLNKTSPVTVKIYAYADESIEYTFDITSLPPLVDLPT